MILNDKLYFLHLNKNQGLMKFKFNRAVVFAVFVFGIVAAFYMMYLFSLI
jgi:hypothetical protein